MVKDQEPEHLCKLFIGGLDYRTTDDSLKSHFEQYGEIVDVIVMKDPQTKRSRGFGFVAFSHSYMVDEAQKNRPHVIDGRTVDTKRAIPRDEIGKSDGGTVKKLFVGGIKDLTEDDIRDCFSQYGEVTNVSIPIERETQKKRGFAFVEFSDSDAADKASLQKEVVIQDTRVDVKKARDKNDMGAGGGRGGGRGGRGGGGGWGGRDSYNQSSGGGWGGSQGGYGGGGYGGQSSGYGSGGYGGQSSWGGQSQGGWGGQGGYDSGSQGGWGGQTADFGNNYGQSYGGGPARTQSYGQGSRPAPYGGGSQGGYGAMSGGSSGGYGSGGGYSSGGNKRY